MDGKKYIIEFKQVLKATVVTSDNCNAISFTNRGVATAVINKKQLLTDKSFSVNGHPGERDMTQYKIEFTGAGTQILDVEIKFYQP